MSATWGSTIAVSTTVRNVLSTPVAASFDVGIYLSADATITINDTPLGTRTVAGIAGNFSDTASTNVTLPPNLFQQFNYRKAITIDATKVSGTGNISNFPLLVSVTDADLKTVANGGKVENANGFDIVFKDANGNNLAFEVEQYTATTGQLIAWVRVPSVSGSVNTTLYISYGSTAITTSQENVAGVWDANYKMVQHLDETAGTHVDSTVNARNLTPFGAINQNAAGKVGGADNFDGINDYLRTSAAVLNPGTSDWTIEVWVKVDTSPTMYIVQTEDNPQGRSLIYKFSDNKLCNYAASGAACTTQAITPGANWYHVSLRHNNASNILYWYINGNLVTTSTGSTQDSNNGLWRLGAFKTGGGSFDSLMDEVRVSNTQRSSFYIQTSYNNQNSPSTFYSIGTEEVTNGGPQVFYLGAIADNGSSVTELSETNNAAVQTGVGGSPESTAVSVVSGSGKTGSGGGAFGIIELLLALLGIYFTIHRRRQILVTNNS
ncbi:MAG: DUF2341 domain-containing protein [Gammaproteobacteria bacterium]